MPRIDQKKNLFKENYFNFFGLLWLIMGLLMWLLLKDSLYLAYFPLGIGTILYGRFTKRSHSAFIEGDKNSITLKEWTENSTTYKFQEIDDITISKGHLTIKSGAANGVMIELKEYKEEDIRLLQQFLPSFPLANQNFAEVKQS